MYLTDEQRKIGRRNFLKAIAALPAAAAFPFVFAREQLNGGPVKAGIVGIGNEGRALLHNTDPDFLNVVAVCDIFPPNRELARRYVQAKFAAKHGGTVTEYEEYTKLLEDKAIEAVIIAAPLHMHAPIAIAALNAGKHVFCEKLMARTVKECKDMIKAADDAKRVLSIGHQRHYSGLYHQALEYVRAGRLGKIHHIRALWHRKTNWMSEPLTTVDQIKDLFKKAAEEINGGNAAYYMDGPELAAAKEALKLSDADATDLAKKAADFETSNAAAKFGYKSFQQLRNWRLFKDVSQGLMGELGSHQLDACGLILGGAHPKAIIGTGHHIGPWLPDKWTKKVPADISEIRDHVYAQFEYDDNVTVTYSSITSNGFENYGEHVFGTKGTMIIEGEKDIMLFDDSPAARSTEIKVEPGAKAGTWTDTSASAPWGGAGPAAAKANSSVGFVGRGYKEELQHFAICVRSQGTPNEQKPRCDGKQALADAIIAIMANETINDPENRKVKLSEKLYDPSSPDVT